MSNTAHHLCSICYVREKYSSFSRVVPENKHLCYRETLVSPQVNVRCPTLHDFITMTTTYPGQKKKKSDLIQKAGSHRHPDSIAVLPAPHTLTWCNHRYRVANGHLYESKQERVGRWICTPPSRGRLVPPLIDRYMILDGDSGVLSRAGRRSR